ncbi:MAG: transposase [Chloroflexi bacterium]|nr:transposase [Chloroflexota bacterium]
MELVDAICSNTTARSVVEYTLTPCFRRTYTALYKAIDGCQWQEEQLARLLGPYLSRPQQRPFWLLGVDVTPQARPYAPTLADRGMVYQPTPVRGNKPVTVGHQYSSVALLPEVEEGVSSSWVVPLRTKRVRTAEDKELVGAKQLDALLQDAGLPFHQELCVEVGDTGYSKPAYLHANRHHPNLVTVARARGNRTFYRQFVGPKKQKGHPKWYGASFSLKKPTTWHEVDEQATTTFVSRRGKTYRVEIQAWYNMLMRGKHKPERIPMHRHPFTLVRIVLYDEQGQPAFQHPLWLIVIGKQRQQLSLLNIYHAYAQRFDMEHFFRFGKQKLLLASFQTPDDKREETWWQLTHLAYAQLWLARHLARSFPRPWERNLPTMQARRMSPTLVQRDFGRIICQIGTPAQPPKRRGNSPGRSKGTRLPPRPRRKVVVKGQKKASSP